MRKTDRIRAKLDRIDDSIFKITMVLKDDDRGHRRLDCKKIRRELGAVKAAATKIENML